jgi:aminoglycoside phosphotransferase (APT) family kinase protein
VDQETLDPRVILAALGLSGPTRSMPVYGGADTHIWRVEHAGQRFALRVFAADQAAMSRREVAAMVAAGNAGLPVPGVHAAGLWGDRPAMVLSWMSGTPVRHELVARPWRAWALGRELGRTQAAIHSVPAPVSLSHPVSWVEWANPDTVLRDCLLALSDQPEVLLHLDYHPMNVLVHQGHITAVLDWANARGGDPRADLARTASILRFGPLGNDLPSPISRVLRRALNAGWRRGYKEIAGPIRGMAPFYAWAGAVMVRDLSPRLGRPDLPWLTPAYLDQVRRWAAAWSHRAGCSG